MLIEALDYATRGVSLDEKLTPLNTWDSNLRVFFYLEVSGQTHLLRACSEKRKHNNNNT